MEACRTTTVSKQAATFWRRNPDRFSTPLWRNVDGRLRFKRRFLIARQSTHSISVPSISSSESSESIAVS